MTPCSFYADQNVAASKTHCSAHDRHPIDCAKALRAELERAKGEIAKLRTETEELSKERYRLKNLLDVSTGGDGNL